MVHFLETMELAPLNFVSHVLVNHIGWSRSGGMLISSVYYYFCNGFNSVIQAKG